MHSRRATLVLAVLFAAMLALASRPSAAVVPPKLAVIIVVDQMRADYVDLFGKDWTAGLKRLVANGAWFQNAAYPYGTTVTCAGHATIGTGAYPRTHGIVANTWWDRATARQVTCTEDPRASGIGYTKPITEGDSGWRLQVPTFADHLRTQRQARVVSLSLKDRSAIMLAGHGGDAVTWLSTSLDGWVTSSAFAEHPVPAVKAFVDANPITADFRKTWSLLESPSHYPQADDQPGEAPPVGWTRTFPHTLTGTSDTPDAAYFYEWERSPFSDAYLGRLAAALVDGFGLGRHDTTDMLGISFSAPDLVGHAFGPRSREVQDIYLHLDRTIGTLLDYLDEKVGRGQWVVALTADHGVQPIPEQLIAEGKDAGRLSASTIAAAVETELRGELGEGKYVAQVIGNDVYLAPGVMDRLRAKPGALNGAMKAINSLPGIARVFRSDEVRDFTAARDLIERAAALSYFPGRSGDLILVPKPGWMFSATGTTHGSATPEDQRVPIIFFGHGIKSGRFLDAATPADIAPTLAAICGLTMSVDGRVLTSALAQRPVSTP